MSETVHDLDAEEQRLRLKQIIADIDAKLWDAHLKRQVVAVEPWKIGLAIASAAAALMGAGAALFAAGAGYIKLIGG